MSAKDNDRASWASDSPGSGSDGGERTRITRCTKCATANGDISPHQGANSSMTAAI